MIICRTISQMIEGDADRHQMVLDDNGQALGQLGDAGVAKKGEFVLHAKMETMVAEKGVTFNDAFRAVMDDPKNAALKQCYAGFTQDRYAMERAQPDPGMTSLEAGAEIDRRVKAYVHDHPETTYRGAMGFVMGADPELKATYEHWA